MVTSENLKRIILKMNAFKMRPFKYPRHRIILLPSLPLPPTPPPPTRAPSPSTVHQYNNKKLRKTTDECRIYKRYFTAD